MAHGHDMTLNEKTLYVGSVANKPMLIGLVLGIAGLGIGCGLGLTGDAAMHKHFFHSYLFAFMYAISIALGALFFVLVQHLTRAGWSVTVRRIAEGISVNVIIFAALVIPIFFGLHELYHWTHAEAVAHDPILQGKAPYLNVPFMTIRMIAYFIVWIGLSFYLRGKSIKQDHTGDIKITRKLEFTSAPGIMAFGVTLTLFAFDLLMSLNPHWFSTMFGVYFFAGAVISFLTFKTLLILWLQKKGLVRDAISKEHIHDLGKLTFAFTFFWGYIAFSQYMLIWYANMPEETQFFTPRQIRGPWQVLSLVLVFCHLLIPFAGLISRHAKRRFAIFAFFAIWMLLAHALDLYWMILPNQWINQMPAVAGDAHMTLPETFAIMLQGTRNVYELKPEFASFGHVIAYPFGGAQLAVTISLWIGMAGLLLAGTAFWLKSAALVPLRDPRLHESLAFENM